jgi:hypothetical protein
MTSGGAVAGKGHDRFELRPITDRRVDLQGRNGKRERHERSRGLLTQRLLVEPGRVGVRVPPRDALEPAQDSLASDIGSDHTADDPDLGETDEALERGAPDMILERRLRHHRYTGAEQDIEHREERRERSYRERIVRARLEIWKSQGHALLDLVTADRRTTQRTGDGVRQRRLAGARRTADDDQDWQCHARNIYLRRTAPANH